jgi:hypothetical protein
LYQAINITIENNLFSDIFTTDSFFEDISKTSTATGFFIAEIKYSLNQDGDPPNLVKLFKVHSVVGTLQPVFFLLIIKLGRCPT